MISFGSPPAFKFDSESKMLKIKIAKPDNDLPVIEDIIQQLQHVKQANVALSGGVDSQFALRVAKQLDVPITAYTYVATWQGAPINSDDVVSAELIAEKENVPLQKVYLDLWDFFETKKHEKYAQQYGTRSPQIAFHLYFIEETFKDLPGTLFLGGEVPMMAKNSGEVEGPMDIAGLNTNFFMSNTVSYRRLCEDNNIDLVRDIPLYTPEIIYKVLRLSIDIVKEKEMHCEFKPDYFLNMYAHKLKHEIYEKIIPGGINPLVKQTGFEKLKKYFAGKTGIYNQFDLLYRKPLEVKARRRQRNPEAVTEDGGIGIDGSVKYIAKKIPQELTKEYREAIEDYNSECVYEYFFDF